MKVLVLKDLTHNFEFELGDKEELSYQVQMEDGSIKFMYSFDGETFYEEGSTSSKSWQYLEREPESFQIFDFKKIFQLVEVELDI